MSPRLEIFQEPDRIPVGRLALIAVAAVLVSVVAVAVAGMLGEPPAPQIAPGPAGTVERTLVHYTERGIDLRKVQRDALGQYGWSDRDAGVAQIPIERAIDLVAAESRGRR